MWFKGVFDSPHASLLFYFPVVSGIQQRRSSGSDGMPSPGLPPVVLMETGNKISRFQQRNSWSSTIGMPSLTDLLLPHQLSLYLIWPNIKAHSSNPTVKGKHALSAAKHGDWWKMQQDRGWQSGGFTLHVLLCICLLRRGKWVMAISKILTW